MAYIIAAIQETGEEAIVGQFDTIEAAYYALPREREKYPEWRNFHVEELRDKDYWSNYYAERYAQGYDHPEDIYEDY
jgi:hypothetical protein